MERRRSHSKEIADEEDKIQTATKDLEQLREELESLASGARVGDESG
jgi:cell division protein FtsL